MRIRRYCHRWVIFYCRRLISLIRFWRLLGRLWICWIRRLRVWFLWISNLIKWLMLLSKIKYPKFGENIVMRHWNLYQAGLLILRRGSNFWDHGWKQLLLHTGLAVSFSHKGFSLPYFKLSPERPNYLLIHLHLNSR